MCSLCADKHIKLPSEAAEGAAAGGHRIDQAKQHCNKQMGAIKAKMIRLLETWEDNLLSVTVQVCTD